MKRRYINATFAIQDDGASGHRIGLEERLAIDFKDDQWIVTNPTGHAAWVGRSDNHDEATLNYFKARLGLSGFYEDKQ